ncbi:hypothetical protein D3C81_1936950 [compost metagenome]
MDVARLGKTFRPVEGDLGERASDVFVLEAAEEGACYLAVFNFDDAQPAHKSVPLARAGLNAKAAYIIQDLWEGTHGEVPDGVLSVTLEPAESKIYKLIVKTGQTGE